MGKIHEKITPQLRSWIAQQKLFFVSTAPLSGAGLINLSPKGFDSFRILDDQTVAYIDLTGSGVETIAHLKENGRITILFSAFEGPPKLLRFYGKGEVFEKNTLEFQSLLSHFPEFPGARAIIKINVHRIADSCGYTVPIYDYKGERDVWYKWCDRKGEAGVTTYQKEKNTQSLDGLEGLNI